MVSNLLEKIDKKFTSQHILSLDQFTISDINLILQTASKLKNTFLNNEVSKILEGNIVALIFYEASSRTFGSFAGAVKRLGGQTIEVLNPQKLSSEVKGETFTDTIRVFETYSDTIVLRHPEIGAAEKAAMATKNTPVINAGDGAGEHPTQALLDLATIQQHCGKLSNLTGIISGDPLNSRAIHSLIKSLALYDNNTLYLLSSVQLRLNRPDYNKFIKNGLKIIEIQDTKDIPQKADFWYWNRLQKERFTDPEEYFKLKNKFIINKKLLQKYAGPQTIIMNPLPRVGEIDPEIDSDPRAVYLHSQIKNGLYIRMAILALVLGKAKKL